MKKNNNFVKHAEIYRVVWGNIRKWQYLNSISDTQLAEILEVSQRTLSNYDNEPHKVTLEKVQLFLINAKITVEQLISI